MATDFYERQYQARRSTKWLVVMFTLGVIGIVGATMAVAWAAVNRFDLDRSLRRAGLLDPRSGFHGGWQEQPRDDLVVPLGAGAAALALIAGGTLFKVAQLQGGGHVVAENLGGRRVFPDTHDPLERRVLNVVEEMALASGVPVPPVFMLDQEEGINAFAAGYAPSDAVVTVTRGAAEQLTRDQLQGVVAHEFSHILNGDMRINIRLIGILNGILLIGLVGRIMLRMMWQTGPTVRRDRDDKGGSGTQYFALIGLALVILGYLGTLMGSLIKAAVSRQRESLADASGVQFTRNPTGLAGALKRIGSLLAGSRLKAPNAAEASHMYFAEGVWEGFTQLTATHPPLRKRILALDPQWDGAYPPAPDVPAAMTEVGEQAAGLVGGSTRGGQSADLPVAVVAGAADQVGDPTEQHRKYAAALVSSLPAEVRNAARGPYGARAVLFCLLADSNNPDIRQKQLARLRELATQDVFELTLKLLPLVDQLDVRTWLPLVDLSLPALRAMSESQYREFLTCFKELVQADNRLGLFEWTLHRILLRHLCPPFEKTAAPKRATADVQQMGDQCSVLLSTLANADNRLDQAATALARGADCLPGVAIRLLRPDECGLGPLSRALDDLSAVMDKQRRHIVNACAACICADQEVTVAEAELLRGVCDMLDCPMPPLLAGGPATFRADGDAA